ncbi:MAG: hotdog fold thioesterase [Bacteroidota bacterium]
MPPPNNPLATRIIDAMFENDDYSQWLGIKRITEGMGYCTLEMIVRREMTNGFNIAHGGITFAFADSALAFASNSRGRKAVSIETSIAHVMAVKPGEVIRAIATETHLSNQLGRYDVKVENQEGATLALFKGTVYRKREKWFEDDN